MCRAKLEAVPFAVRIGFLASMGGSIAATLFADTGETSSQNRAMRAGTLRQKFYLYACLYRT